jgi:hypothetical protein
MWTAAHSRVPSRAESSRFRVILLIFLLIAASHFACAPAVAQVSAALLEEGRGRWMEIDRNPQGVVYLDVESLEQMGDEIWQVRTRWAFTQPQRNSRGAPYASSVAVRAVDCRTRELALLAYADRDREAIVDEAEMPLFTAHWEPARPRSVSHRIVTSACLLAAGGSSALAALP